MTRNRSTRRDIASMTRATDTHTATGKRSRQHRPQPRRQGTRAAIVRAATREGGA